MSDDNRFSDGTFSNLPASSFEQRQHGVTSHDNEHSARMKVLSGQMNADQPNFVGKPFSAGTRKAFLAIAALIILAVGALWGSSKLKALPFSPESRSSIHADFSQFDSAADRARTRAYVAKHFASLFQPDTPLPRMFSYCESRDCRLPDRKAFMAFKKYALEPAKYEAGVCDYYFKLDRTSADVWQDWPHDWEYDASTSTCRLKNYADLERRFFVHNLGQMTPGLLLIAGLLAVIALLWRRIGD